jgi:hypothetical protein
MPDDLAPRGFYEGLTARYLLPGWKRREHRTGSKSEMLAHAWRAEINLVAWVSGEPHYTRPGMAFIAGIPYGRPNNGAGNDLVGRTGWHVWTERLP